MSFMIHPLNVRDLTYVVANIREPDWYELKSQLPLGAKKEDAIQYIMPTLNGPGWSVYYKDQPIAIFGLTQTSIPTLWVMYAFGTNKFKRAARAISAFGLQQLSHFLINQGALRLEIRANKKHNEATHWLEKIGFTRETDLECFGTNGDTFVQYSITAKNYYKLNGIPKELMQ